MDSYISAKLHLVESPETSSLEDFLKAQQRISTSHFEPRAKQQYIIGAYRGYPGFTNDGDWKSITDSYISY